MRVAMLSSILLVACGPEPDMDDGCELSDLITTIEMRDADGPCDPCRLSDQLTLWTTIETTGKVGAGASAG